MRRLDWGVLFAAGFSFGIFLGSFLYEAYWEMLLFCLIGSLGIFVGFFQRKNFLKISFFLLSCSGGLFFLHQDQLAWERVALSSGFVSGNGQIISELDRKSFFSEALLRFYSCESDFCPKEAVLVAFPRSAVLFPGDKIVLSCVLSPPRETIRIEGRDIPWRMIRFAQGIGYECRSSQWEALSQEDFFSFRRMFLFKEEFLEVLDQELSPHLAPLGTGMLLGSNDIPPGDREIFVRTGLSHVTAVSGYNIVLVGGAIFLFSILFGCFRRTASIVAIFGIVLYVILVGAPASAVRAGIMGSALFFGFLVGRPGSGWRFLFLALALMLAVHPLALRYDVGLQLSFLATLAIFFFGSLRISFLDALSSIPRLFLEGMILTFVIELFLIPLSIMQFGQFSLVSVFANAFLLPLVPVIMLLVFLTGLIGLILPPIAFLFAWPASFFLELFFFGATFFSRIPFSQVSFSGDTPLLLVCLWYVGVGFLFFFFHFRKKQNDL